MSGLTLDDGEKQRLYHRATGYGVEFYGGTPEDRQEVFEEYFDEPLVIIDASTVDSSEELVKQALLEMSVASESELENLYQLGYSRLTDALEETESSFVITNFDSLPSDARTSIAQMMKAVAETLSVEVMLGYGCEEGGSVVHAEPDLRMRVYSWELE